MPTSLSSCQVRTRTRQPPMRTGRRPSWPTTLTPRWRFTASSPTSTPEWLRPQRQGRKPSLTSPKTGPASESLLTARPPASKTRSAKRPLPTDYKVGTARDELPQEPLAKSRHQPFLAKRKVKYCDSPDRMSQAFTEELEALTALPKDSLFDDVSSDEEYLSCRRVVRFTDPDLTPLTPLVGLGGLRHSRTARAASRGHERHLDLQSG